MLLKLREGHMLNITNRGYERKSRLDVGAALSFIRRLFDDIAAIQLEPLAACRAQQWHGRAGWPPCGLEIGAVVRAHHEVHLLQGTPQRSSGPFPEGNLTRRAADEDAPGRALDLGSKACSSPTLQHEALDAVNNTYAYSACPVLQLAGRMS